MRQALKPKTLSGDELRALRERQTVEGRPMDRKEFAALLHTTAEHIKNCELEKSNARLRGPAALLARITFDPLARAQWIRGLTE